MAFIKGEIVEISGGAVSSHQKIIVKYFLTAFGLIVPCGVNRVPISVVHFYVVPHMVAFGVVGAANRDTRYAVAVAKQFKSVGVTCAHGSVLRIPV